MSPPIRGDVKKKFSPFPLREETDGGLHPAESQFWRGCGLAAYSGQTGQLAFVLDGFMTPWSFDAFGSGSYASRRVGFSGPTMVLSETRGLQLFGLCEGAYGAFGGSVLNDCTQGLAHRLILSLDPERRKNRLANHRVNKPGLAWSCRRSSCLRFQMFCVETSSFFPKCQRDGRDLACEREASHFRLHSPGQQSCVKILQWSRATTGAQGRTFEDPLHLVVVILIQTTDLLWLLERCSCPST